ncbi:MAG: hypothetical protein L0H59_05290 [Tomitella sp.]|nr:hypothetical protein [Tomitella sp.]
MSPTTKHTAAGYPAGGTVPPGATHRARPNVWRQRRGPEGRMRTMCGWAISTLDGADIDFLPTARWDSQADMLDDIHMAGYVLLERWYLRAMSDAEFQTMLRHRAYGYGRRLSWRKRFTAGVFRR